jgi:hypothetical protein
MSDYITLTLLLDEMDNNIDLFLDIMEWCQGISWVKYSTLIEILNQHGFHLPSHFHLQSYLQNITGLHSQYFDCCPNSCMAYTGQYSDLTECPHCGDA